MAADETPTLGGTGEQFPERLRIAEVRSFPDLSGDKRLYAALVELTDAMTASGPDAESNYQELLRRQREDDEFVALLVSTLDALDESRYIERWALVQLLADLEHPASADYFTEFVERNIPQEQAEDTAHGLSTVTEEVVLRTTAIEGLARLSRHGVDTTDVLLRVIASSEYVAMRRAAWFALVHSGHDGAVDRARELLVDRGDGWIADLRRLPAREAEQQDPELVDPGRGRDDGIPSPFGE